MGNGKLTWKPGVARECRGFQGFLNTGSRSPWVSVLIWISRAKVATHVVKCQPGNRTILQSCQVLRFPWTKRAKIKIDQDQNRSKKDRERFLGILPCPLNAKHRYVLGTIGNITTLPPTPTPQPKPSGMNPGTPAGKLRPIEGGEHMSIQWKPRCA